MRDTAETKTDGKNLLCDTSIGRMFGRRVRVGYGQRPQPRACERSKEKPNATSDPPLAP
jgi:hypothetical protein